MFKIPGFPFLQKISNKQTIKQQQQQKTQPTKQTKKHCEFANSELSFLLERETEEQWTLASYQRVSTL